MTDETLQSVSKTIANSLRVLKELEDPALLVDSEPAGGPHRHAAMAHLRQALHDVSQAVEYERDRRRARTQPVEGFVARRR